jgi:hypothetical protein
MNEVTFQSNWVGALRKEYQLEGMRVRQNQSFLGQYLVGGRVEIHQIGMVLKEIEKETKGSLQSAECRFTTRHGDVSTSTLNGLGLVCMNNEFVMKKQDFVLRLNRIEEDYFYIWKVEFELKGYMIPETLGQILTRLISLIKYEADVSPQPAYLKVVG